MSKYGLIETAKRQKGKAITLGLLFVMMSAVWGKALLGGEEDPRSKRKASSSSSASKSATSAKKSDSSSKSVASSSKKKSAASKSSSSKAPKSIKDFTTAIARLDAWAVPLRIERKGPLTDEYVEQVRAAARAEDEARSQRFARAREAGQLAADADSNSALLALPDAQTQEATEAAEKEQAEAPPAAPLIVAEDMEVDLTLTGTALLGDTRFALFGERRVQEGDQIGRYRVHAVRSREVDVVIDGKLTVIRIAPPDLD